MKQAIEDRIRNGVNPFKTLISKEGQPDVDLNIVRLCFQAFTIDDYGKPSMALPPVVSNNIYDKSKFQFYYDNYGALRCCTSKVT